MDLHTAYCNCLATKHEPYFHSILQHLDLCVDPSATLPSLFLLVWTKSGWCAGTPTKIQLAVSENVFHSGGIRIWRLCSVQACKAREINFWCFWGHHVSNFSLKL